MAPRRGHAETLDWTSLLGFALLHSVPWGLAVTASGWLPRSQALACLLAVAVSAAVSLAAHDSIARVANPGAGFLAAALVALGVLGHRLLVDRRRPDGVTAGTTPR